jgi:toxin ParE1/3/4
MPYPVRFTAQSEQDLRDVWRGLAEFGGLENADQKRLAIREKIKLLRQFPHAGRSRDEILPGLRSLAIQGFVIFYRFDQTVIEIARVLHGKRDILAIFNESDDASNADN